MDNMIDIDFTILIQFANFVVTLFVLNFLLIKPVRDQIATRKNLLSGYAADAEQFTASANQKLTSYEESLAKARAEAAIARDSIKTEGVQLEQEMLSKAHQQAQAYLQSSRDQVAQDTQAAMETLRAQVNSFATKAINKILG